MDKEKQSYLVEQISFRHSERMEEFSERSPQRPLRHPERICVRTECNESGLREYRVGRAVRLENEAIRAWSKSKKLVSGSKNNHRKVAFTLAEVLITLGIIGVVAAITLPMFMENVNSRVKAKRMENIHQKLSKVTDKMASLDVLQGQGSTHNFVYEMKKHMNIAKICENNNLAGCWPTATVTLSDGKTWEIAKTKTGKTLKAKDKDSLGNATDWDDTMGIVTADGTSMIISYNKKCSFDANTNGLHYDNSTGMSNTLTSGCLAIVYDWNGGSRPNKVADDVQFLGGATGLGNNCAYTTKSGLCIAGAAHKPAKPMSRSECNTRKTELGIDECGVDPDYWAAAVAECGSVDKMVNFTELSEIATEIYGETIFYGDINGLTWNNERAAALGLPDARNGEFCVWFNANYTGSTAGNRVFYSNRTYWSKGVDRKSEGSNRLVLCKGE